MSELAFVLYWLAIAGLLVHGLNCYVLCVLSLRHRKAALERTARVRARPVPEAELPFVTVQLPIYNERFVVGRLLTAASRLDWPRDRLEIQVLDDSTDDTRLLAEKLVREHSARGVPMRHLHRTHRTGFKAGALREGLHTARGEFVAIFDADFVPQASFLRDTLPFFAEPKVGLVQARWGHLNAGQSALTGAQAVAIDGHFGIEQSGRCWGGLFLNFNGTAGVWRKSAIADAGGWQADTLTEDLDLSYRAQLRGWKVEFLFDVEVPAEIPADIAAFKSQQRRWAKGSIQTAKKLLPRVLRSELPFFVKLQAVMHLTHYAVHPLMVAVALLSVPVLAGGRGGLEGWTLPLSALGLLIGTCGPSTLYVCSQRALHADWARRILRLPMLMLIGTGIAVSNTRAVLEALAGLESGFVRTPKTSATDGARGRAVAAGYRLPFDLGVLLELALAAWCALGFVIYWDQGKYVIGPFLALYTLGFAFVAGRSLLEAWRAAEGARPLGLPEPAPGLIEEATG